MTAMVRLALRGGLVFVSLTLMVRAQDSAPTPKATIDYSNDPCGNPMIESQLWTQVKAKVSRVIDGRTLIAALPHNSQPLRITLVGVGLASKEQMRAQAKELVSRWLLRKDIEISIKPGWDSGHKKPGHVTAMVNLDPQQDDVALLLLSKGLVKFQEPASYSISRYTECQYKHAEAAAQAKKLGIWK